MIIRLRRYSPGKDWLPVWQVFPETTTAEFAEALEDVNTYGGTIYFSEGEFRGLFPITITHSDVTLSGEGSLTKIICDTPNSGSFTGVINVSGTVAVPVKNVVIEKLLVDGDYSSDNANRKYYGVSVWYAQCCSIKNCTVQNSNNNGIDLNASLNNAITGNTAQNNNSQGIFLNASSNNNTVTGNTVQNNNHGIYLDSSSNNNITGNTVQNNGHGIHLDNSSNNNTVTGNTVQNNTINGIINKSTANVFMSNVITQAAGAHINSTGTYALILGNQMLGAGTGFTSTGANSKSVDNIKGA